MKKIQITLPQENYSYSVHIGSQIIKESLEDIIDSYSESVLYVVTNTTIKELYPDLPDKMIPDNIDVKTLVLPDGERFKNLKTISSILDFLAQEQANRQSILIAFGGGVIGDMAGFAAALFMRGIRYIQIPTTLLSQVDSGIGGKTGVNHEIGKNMIGAFKQPLRTIIDIDVLKTLPRREFIAGYAELVKHGFIRNRTLLEHLSQKSIDGLISDSVHLSEAIRMSCQVKADVVQEDEKEAGLRAILNFGHTLGHVLETITEYKTLLHGEAVIVGMDFASWWSVKRGILSQKDFETIHGHLKQLEIRAEIRSIRKDEFIEIITHDKKAVSKSIKFIGLTDIGSATICEDTTAESLWQSYQEYLTTDSLLKINPA